ncbi:glycosyltransferase family 87 protein [Burkholderia sp. PU8-34]
MYEAIRGLRGRRWRGVHWLTADRIVPYSCAMLILCGAIFGAWAMATHGFTTDNVMRPGFDFAVFWTASDLTLHGQIASVFDYHRFSVAEFEHFSNYTHRAFLPWLYPPTMLLVVAPLAFVPFLPAFFLFFAGSFLCYARAVNGLSGLRAHLPQPRLATLAVLAYPGVFVTTVCGQNALLTAAIAAFAVRHVERRPVVAGLFISLLAVKPQLAVLFPVVLIAARAWRAFAAAAAGTVLLVATSTWLAGHAALTGFIDSMSITREALIEHNVQYWIGSPTPFAAMRLAGLPLPLSYAVQIAVALLAAVAAATVWRSTRDVRLRGAVIAVATLLATPYLRGYELAWLGVAVFCLVSYGFDKGWLPGDQGILVLAWLLPLFEFLNYTPLLPQIGPIVLLAVLFVVARRAAVAARS